MTMFPPAMYLMFIPAVIGLLIVFLDKDFWYKFGDKKDLKK
jgi:hypothetical protein